MFFDVEYSGSLSALKSCFAFSACISVALWPSISNCTPLAVAKKSELNIATIPIVCQKLSSMVVLGIEPLIIKLTTSFKGSLDHIAKLTIINTTPIQSIFRISTPFFKYLTTLIVQET